ncbi:MAG: hypothetical protein M1840_004414 [Geoglossum simile]|nr:MAG: hypothetical protein M1840_004414 [Geoglossum simile]
MSGRRSSEYCAWVEGEGILSLSSEHIRDLGGSSATFKAISYLLGNHPPPGQGQSLTSANPPTLQIQNPTQAKKPKSIQTQDANVHINDRQISSGVETVI